MFFCVKLAWLLLGAWRVYGFPEVCMLTWVIGLEVSGSELIELTE